MPARHAAPPRHQFFRGVFGKMISPQNISTGTSTTELKGREGDVFARTFKHSLILTFLLGLLVCARYVRPVEVYGCNDLDGGARHVLTCPRPRGDTDWQA